MDNVKQNNESNTSWKACPQKQKTFAHGINKAEATKKPTIETQWMRYQKYYDFDAAADERTETRFETSRPPEIRQRRKGQGLCRNEHILEELKRVMMAIPEVSRRVHNSTSALKERAQGMLQRYARKTIIRR